MRILLHHISHMPAIHYGGTERLVIWLARALTDLGHDVSLVAAAGSKSCPGVKTLFQGEDDFFTHGSAQDYDILHTFSSVDQKWNEMFDGRIITTIGGNGKIGEEFHLNTVFVSQDHAQRHSSDSFVHNGLDPDELSYHAGERPKRYLFLSKTSWRVKNVRAAIRWCKEAKQNLWVAGGSGPLLQHLDVMLRPGWRWVGSVNQVQKAGFLTQGRALLFPVLWNEPFGLAMVESLVSGTPVFGPNYGSVPEVLGKNTLCATKEDWMDVIRGFRDLPTAKECRDRALSLFHYQDMAKNYLNRYEIILNGKTLNSSKPVTKFDATTKQDGTKIKGFDGEE